MVKWLRICEKAETLEGGSWAHCDRDFKAVYELLGSIIFIFLSCRREQQA